VQCGATSDEFVVGANKTVAVCYVTEWTHYSDTTVAGGALDDIANNTGNFEHVVVGDYVLWQGGGAGGEGDAWESGAVDAVVYNVLYVDTAITNGGPLAATTYSLVDSEVDCEYLGPRLIESDEGTWANTTAADYFNWNPASDDDWVVIDSIVGSLLTLAADVTANTGTATVYSSETKVNYPFRMRWSDVGDSSNWTSTNFTDLLEMADQVLAAEVWGMNLILFHSTRMSICAYVASPNYFNVRTLDPAVGISAPHTLRSIPLEGGNALIWLAHDGVYTYRGGAPERISEQIEPELFEDVAPEVMRISTSAVFPVDDLYIMFTPNALGEISRVWFFNYRTGQWTRGALDDITAAVSITRVPYTDWATWYALIAANDFDALNALSTQQTMMLLGDLDGDVWSATSETSGTDEASWESPPVRTAKGIRVMRLEVTGKGHPVHIEWSDDEGVTWRGDRVVPFVPGEYTMHSVGYSMSTRDIRFRIKQTTGALSIRRLDLFFKEMEK